MGLGRDGTLHEMGPMSPVRAHCLWAGLCLEKLVELKLKAGAQTSERDISFFNFFPLENKGIVGLLKTKGRLFKQSLASVQQNCIKPYRI